MRVIKHFKFKTDFYSDGYEHNLYDVDVEDVELSQSKSLGSHYWKLMVRGREYVVAPVLDMPAQDIKQKINDILDDIQKQIDGAAAPINSKEETDA